MSNRLSTQPKILVILGPTASGKSALAVALARTFNGEVISADSRQVYKEMDLGTGKITKKEMRGVRHHLLDVTLPKKKFDVVQWKEIADKAITDITRRDKLPIVCGGTGLYIKALTENITYPDVPPDWKLRKKLEKKSVRELFAMLEKLDPQRAKTIDPDNPRRLMRAIEIAIQRGKAPISHFPAIAGEWDICNIQNGNVLRETSVPRYDVLIIGIKKSYDELKKEIARRLVERIRKGMVAEARKLHQQGVSWKRMEEIGLEYKYLALHLQGKLTKKEMAEALNAKSWQYARRQMTWFRKTKNVRWIGTLKEAEKLVREFVKKK